MSSIKLVTFDLDDTLIQQNSWLVLNRALGISDEEDSRLYNLYAQGELSYEDWMQALLLHYQKCDHANRSFITQVLTGYTLMDGVKRCVSTLHNNGIRTALISGSLDVVVEHVAQHLGIPHVFACNALIFDEDDILQTIEHSGDEHIAKTNYLKQLLRSLNVAPHECACVGDGANDRDMFELTGRGITFRGSKIEHDAWKVVDTITEIPDIIGQK